MRGFGWLAWLTFFLLAAGCVSAGFTMILSVVPAGVREDNTIPLSLELVNSGDEKAFDGTLQLVYPKDMALEPVVYGVIEPGVPNKKDVDVKLASGILPGVYPLVFSLQFRDSNNYPIYMVFDSRLTVGEHSVSKVHGRLSSVVLRGGGEGKLTLTLKNADDKPHVVGTMLILPNSLASDKTGETVELAPQTEVSVDYRIRDFMALPASDFLVLAALEYEEDGVHHSELARGRVKIGETSERLPLASAVAGVLLVLAVYSYVKLRK